MKRIVKAILVGSAPAIVAGTLQAGSQPTTQPTTQPATQPASPPIARDNSPLVIPDGTSRENPGPGTPVPIEGGSGPVNVFGLRG